MRISDAAKRCADQYALHRVADPVNSIGKWFAVRLSDGQSDGTLYDTKSDAVRHQKHNETFYAFVQVGPWSMDAREADQFLAINRRLYDHGIRLADPDHAKGGRDVIRRATAEDQRRQLRAMFIGDKPPTNIRHTRGS